MTPPRTTTRMLRAERHAQLLTAARDVIAARGYHASAMDDIADRAGVSKPVLYSHFAGKHELYLSLLDRCAAEVMEAIQSSLESQSDNRMRGFAVLESFFQLLQDDDVSFRLIFQSDTSDDEVRSRVEAVELWSTDLLAGIIREEAGINDEEALLLANALAGMTQSAARHWIQHPDSPDRERTTQLLAMLIWQGIGGLPTEKPSERPGGTV